MQVATISRDLLEHHLAQSIYPAIFQPQEDTLRRNGRRSGVGASYDRYDALLRPDAKASLDFVEAISPACDGLAQVSLLRRCLQGLHDWVACKPQAGEGIGLYIVKRLCDLFRWDIQVANRPGGGVVVALNIGKAGPVEPDGGVDAAILQHRSQR